jgi:hypothetical protein
LKINYLKGFAGKGWRLGRRRRLQNATAPPGRMAFRNANICGLRNASDVGGRIF